MAPEAAKSVPALVSVLVPAYRSGDALTAALESVFVQDYPALQIVVCDDGTEDFDETSLLLLAQAHPDIEVKFLHHPENLGTVRNLNKGLPLCSGEWVMLLAGDDALAGKGVISHLTALAEERGSSWVLGRTMLCDEKLWPQGKLIPTEETIAAASSPQTLYAALCRNCVIPSSGSIYRLDLIRELGGLDEHFRLVEDWPLFLKLTRRGQVPVISGDVTLLHRGSGVSWNRANLNRIYQTDLLETMRREIMPYLDCLEKKDRDQVRIRFRDKEEVYRFRFELTGWPSRLLWAAACPDVLARKLIEKIRG